MSSVVNKYLGVFSAVFVCLLAYGSAGMLAL